LLKLKKKKPIYKKRPQPGRKMRNSYTATVYEKHKCPLNA
jgi:hypothetical protein